MLCLILDLDGTLFSETELMLRPFAKEFIEHVFTHFKHVAIWTAASKEHLDECLTILYPLVPENKQFAFTWYSDRISRGMPRNLYNENLFTNGNTLVFKNLIKVWKSKTRQELGFTKATTLLIDNTPSVYYNNRGNGIHIQTFNGEPDDTHLLIMIDRLTNIKRKFETCGNIRQIKHFY
jgi:TFIIF-interacting CTD phosphatase-like protein